MNPNSETNDSGGSGTSAFIGADKAGPLVSVIMTVFNGQAFVRESIESLLGQTYTNLEVIVVDDGSTDGTVDLVSSMADERVMLVPRNRQGRGKSLNDGIACAGGEYVAINDVDDVSLACRIEREVVFMEQNSEIGMVGTFHHSHDVDRGESVLVTYPTDHGALKLGLTRGQPFAHQTIMFRKRVIDAVGGYSEDISFMFDREIFIRIAAITRIANIPEPLVVVRHHGNRFFYHTYRGKERELMHFRMRMKACRMLGYHWSRSLPAISGYVLCLLGARGILSKLVPRRMKESAWKWVSSTDLPGRRILADGDSGPGVAGGSSG